MIICNKLSISRGGKLLFEEASFNIFAKQKIGIIGVNGCGKSTLFSLLSKELIPDNGYIEINSNIEIVHLAQEISQEQLSALQYVISGDKDSFDILQKLEQAEKKQDYTNLALLHAHLYDINGYSAKARAAELLTGLGFQPHDHNKLITSFSGGWQMRLNLAKTLMCQSDLLLLDEPTNHLDIDAIIWLENWLKKYSGTLLLISHDREFLDNTVNHIMYINNKSIELYTGNYSCFEKQKSELFVHQNSIYKKKQEQINHIMKFVKRFRYKATKAKQIQSRLKTLEKIENTIMMQKMNDSFCFSFEKIKNCSAPLVNFEQVSFSYYKNAVLSNINFQINPQDRIGILGANGIGKSTLIKLIAKLLKPVKGEIFLNKSLIAGYFAQNQIDQLDLTITPFQHLTSITPFVKEQEIRNFLGKFGFSGDMAFAPIHNLSGGEKARLALAQLVWLKPNLLLLDEPTNHLDIQMREALMLALQSYSGALVLVSHDRNLLKTTVDEFFIITDKSLLVFDGDIEKYEDLKLNKNISKRSLKNIIKR